MNVFKKKHWKKYFFTCISIVLVINSAYVFAEEAEDINNTNSNDNSVIANKISSLKEKVIQLNRNLFILQEELLFPTETQVAVFISVDSGVFYKLDSIELRLDNEIVTHYLYTEHEREALQRGGVQRLWVGNIKNAKHEITAFFKGTDHEGRAIENAATLEFEKTDEAAMLELRVVDSNADMRPHFSIKTW